MQVSYCDHVEATVRCQVVRRAIVRYKRVLSGSLCAELQNGVSQQCLVMTKTVLLGKNSTVVSTSHSSAFTQPNILMSRTSAGEKM